MSALFGALGAAAGSVVGAAGAVVGAAGSAVTFVGTGVADVALRALEELDSDEEGESRRRGAADDDGNYYESKFRVDQVLGFFECEYDRYSGFVEDPECLEASRVDYYNCVNAIEFQNNQIAHLVDEVVSLRSQLRSGVFDGLPPAPAIGFGSRAMQAEERARKEASVRLAHAKLDIGERRSKRRGKEKERQEAQARLNPLIADAKVKRLLEEQAAAATTDMAAAGDASNKRLPGQPSQGRHRPKDAARSDNNSCYAGSHETVGGGNGDGGARFRRRCKHYSDAELSALLRDKDD